METNVYGNSGGVNSGFLARLWLIPIDEVLGVLDPELFSSGEAFTVPASGLPTTEEAEVSRLNFPAGGGSFEEILTRGAEGPVYTMTIEAMLPKNETDLLAFLHRNQARRWLAICEDRNGGVFVSGEPGRGLDLFLTRAIVETSSIRISLSGRSWHPAFRLEDADLETLLPYSRITYQTDYKNYL
ncbi:hypothetical protein [Spirosoma sp.]|uniref:hypothetical protein n=1 Tax=Spirosoma sp. TaxID=1899569 RepID=UPI00260E5428|nr:hypothetical protein [Spirosoma sp.]MCX6216561.1 hypothetical protein [Spirosoma sp.]